MVRAGQEGGFLEDVLRRIADFTENQEELKGKVVGAMAYPVILSIVGVLVITVLMLFVVPQFEPMFKMLEEKGEMPTLTVCLLAVSRFLLSPAGIVGFVILFGGVFGYIAWSRTPSGRVRVDGWRLRIWGIGPVFLSYALARFTRILGTMLHNGIPILQALRIAKDSTGNKVLALAIEKSADSITAGDKLATPLAACKYFPRDIIEMIAVGEESNSLDKVLVDIANGLEKRTARQLDLFVRLLEPMMLLIMALLVGLVLAALLMPVFRMGSVIH
jgi:general secretion pathway protein F/type IV pilus assembly protein PilC